MSRHRTTLAAFILAMFVSACGQSGPLYIPGNPSEVEVPAQRPVPEVPPAEDEDDDQNDDQDSDR